MLSGNLTVPITDLWSKPMSRVVEIEVRRDPGPNGAGGGDADYEFDAPGATEAHIQDIATRGGPGSLHRFRFSARGYLDSAFAQFIAEGENRALQNVYMVRNPKKVAAITAPSFGELPQELQDWLALAEMIAERDEAWDLVGKRGAELYDALGDKRKAAVLNIFRKATHTATVGNIWKHIGELMVIRPDRCFAKVSAALRESVSANPRFVIATAALHKALKGYRISDSVKSDDKHANFQITFQQDAGGSLAADLDIDEHTGFEHWGEVLRNFFTSSRTNPFAVHELLLAADLKNYSLDPGYDLVLA